MKYGVRLLPDAESDLVEIWDFVAVAESERKADRLLDKLEKRCLTLESFPDRGRVPRELADFGITDYRELIASPYRIIYRLTQRTVFVYAVLDGRRDLSDVLHRRLIR